MPDEHPALGATMPAGGVGRNTNLRCQRCDGPATRTWEGATGHLQLCESCHDDLADWLERDGEWECDRCGSRKSTGTKGDRSLCNECAFGEAGADG